MPDAGFNRWQSCQPHEIPKSQLILSSFLNTIYSFLLQTGARLSAGLLFLDTLPSVVIAIWLCAKESAIIGK